MSMAEIEKEVLLSTLQYVENNRAKAAKILEISKRTIFRKIKEYSLCDE
jgi:DNA-binding protein Fis